MSSVFKTVLTLTICVLECLLHGGIVLGWPSLAYIYKDQGLFACQQNQTANRTGPCKNQERFIPLAFTMSLVAYGLFALPIGWSFDRFGLRAVRTVATLIGIGGCLCLAFASEKNPFLIFPGTILLGISSTSVGVTSMHIAELAAKKISAVTIVMHGAVNSSGVVFLLVKAAYDNGISQKWSLILVASSWTLVLLSTYLLLPSFKIKRDPDGPEADVEEHNIPRVWHHICSFRYIIHLGYLNILHVWAGLVVGISNTWLNLLLHGDKKKVSFYINMYIYIQIACGLLVGPFAGFMTELVRKCVFRKEDAGKESSHAVITGPGMLVACLSFLIVGVAIELHQLWSVYVVFIFNDVGKAFFYGSAAAYISLMFPKRYFGVLYGLLFTSTAFTLPVQYGYILWAETSGYAPVVGFIMATVVLSMCHPIALMVNFFRVQRPKANKISAQ